MRYFYTGKKCLKVEFYHVKKVLNVIIFEIEFLASRHIILNKRLLTCYYGN